MNLIVQVIAIVTFVTLAFMPMAFTRRSGSFRSINRITGWIMAILVIPCLYWETGLIVLAMAWGCCVILAFISRFEPILPPCTGFIDNDRIIPRPSTAPEKIQVLEQLATLKARGLLSPEEFIEKKKQILS